MRNRSIGFVGGGRVTRILLEGFRRAGALPETCVVSDVDEAALDALRGRFPEVRPAGSDPGWPARQQVVFGALHPPQLREALPEIARHLRDDSIFVSLAPVIRLPALSAGLDGFGRVARMIPNAASIVGAGFNPIAFADGLPAEDRRRLIEGLSVIGECPEVPDDRLESYAIVTAMGPTYFWYQFEELERVGASLSLDAAEARHAVERMLRGSLEAWFGSGLPAEALLDLIPVKPLQSSEETVREAYRFRLRGLYEKLESSATAAPALTTRPTTTTASET